MTIHKTGTMELPSAEGDSTETTGIELSVVMPCLNEAETLAICICKARRCIEELGISAEIVIADNGSVDGSQAIAWAEGARVVNVERRGYGAALRSGIGAARGSFVIMADADDSYALDDLGPFVEALRAGADLVMGNRFRGGIESGAMPVIHRYLGNPVLSFLGRLFFGISIGDFHCGMRGFSRERILELSLRTSGMEFASEMVVRSALAQFKIVEVPTTLAPAGRSRPPHLRTWRDGWRHLRFLLAFSPRWLLLYPGSALLAIGSIALIWLLAGPQRVGDVAFDVHTMLAATTAVVVGVNAIALAVIVHAQATHARLLPVDRRLEMRLGEMAVHRGVGVGVAAVAAGVGCFAYALLRWGATGFGELDAVVTMRIPILGIALITVGVQCVLTSIVVGLTRLEDL
jgi:Glycosyl transferase family 2